MDETQELEFLMNYPAVIEHDGKYTGYIFVDDESYPVCIIPNEDNSTYRLEENAKLSKFHTKNTANNPVELLNSLKSAITNNSSATKTPFCPTETWRNVLREFTEFNNYYITIKSCRLTPELSAVEIVHVDAEERQHGVTVGINYDKGRKLFEIVAHDLPESGGDFQPEDSLVLVFDRFVGAVDAFQTFFDLTDRIDASCWVLDPEHPARKDCYRRIALNDKLSMVATFSPTKMQQQPDIKFLGPLNLVNPLMEKLEANHYNWDIHGDVLGEILKLLEMDSFPPKPHDRSEGELVLVNVGECCVCFSLRLDDKLPEIVCPNPSCSQFFHSECLYQWFNSLKPNIFGNRVYGQCPNCEKVIECPIPKSKS